MDASILSDKTRDLDKFAAEHAAAYQNAHPFPHIVMDGFFDEGYLSRALGDFPSKDDIRWEDMRFGTHIKLATRHERQIPLSLRNLIYQLNSATFLQFLEKLTGIPNLMPDPHLVGGGLHMIMPGGKLAIHADFNKHPVWNVDRRLNLLVYLNKEWEESYGGHFELWNKDMTTCEAKVLPVFNRVVVFSTTDFSYHGHPQPLTCPPDRSRRSIALYYYSNGRPDAEKSADHSTLFRSRPTDNPVKDFVKQFIPPIGYRIIDKLSGR